MIGKLIRRLRNNWPFVTKVRWARDIADTDLQFQSMRQRLAAQEELIDGYRGRPWKHSTELRTGDTIVNNTGKYFVVYEQQTSEIITQKPKRIQRKRSAAKGKRV